MILIASTMGWQLTSDPWLGGPDVRCQLRASAAFAALLRRVRRTKRGRPPGDRSL